MIEKDSMSETGALVPISSFLNNVCPEIFNISPEITSASITSLLIYFAKDGFIKYSSRLMTFGVTPKTTLNKILIDSSVPFDA